MTDPEKPPLPFQIVDRRGAEEPAPAPPAPTANDDAPPAEPQAAPRAKPEPVAAFIVTRMLLPDDSLVVSLDFPEGQRPLKRVEVLAMLTEAIEIQRAEFAAIVTTDHLARASRLAIPTPTIAGLRGPRPPGR